MKYCAFLRGVNVNGTSMKMKDVCNVFEKAGMHDVSSVLASGNILFSSSENVSDLKIILEKALSGAFQYDAFLFLKNEQEIREMRENNPFKTLENQHIYVFIGTDDIEKALLEEFDQSLKSEHEKAEIVGSNFYWQVDKGSTLQSEFGKILGKKSFKSRCTSRNINTIDKILNKW